MTPFKPFSPDVMMGGGWQCGDDIPDRYYDLVSDGPDRDADPYTRRLDLPGGGDQVQVAFYREPLRLPGRYLWIVSRSHLDVGDFHEWIYRSRRRAEEQWTRTLATDPPLFGCAEIGCDHVTAVSCCTADRHPTRPVRSARSWASSTAVPGRFISSAPFWP